MSALAASCALANALAFLSIVVCDVTTGAAAKQKRAAATNHVEIRICNVCFMTSYLLPPPPPRPPKPPLLRPPPPLLRPPPPPNPPMLEDPRLLLDRALAPLNPPEPPPKPPRLLEPLPTLRLPPRSPPVSLARLLIPPGLERSLTPPRLPA